MNKNTDREVTADNLADGELGNLAPRDVALLVALHMRPRPLRDLSVALDVPMDAALDALLSDLVRRELVAPLSPGLMQRPFEHFELTADGIAWLRRHGLDARYRP